MPTYVIDGYAVGSVVVTGGGTPTTGSTFRLDPGWSSSTAALTITVTDDDTGFSGSAATVLDGSQTGVVITAAGATVGSGTIRLGNGFTVTDPVAGSVTIYQVMIGSTVVGYTTTAPLQPGVLYTVGSTVTSTATGVPYTSLAMLDYEQAADNSVVGGAGNDQILAGEGADTVQSGAGNDTVFGGAGNDQIDGGALNDQLDGGLGNDTVLGGTGDDVLTGWDGDDQLQGGDGNDVLTGDGPAAANLITNGTFASGLSGWTVNNPTGGAAPITYTAGTPASPGVGFNNNDEAAIGDSIQQTITTQPGETYDLSLRLYENGSGVGTHTVVVTVLDASGNVVSSQTYVVLNGTIQNPTFAFTATTSTMTIRITNTASTTSVNSDLMVDDVSVVGRNSPAGNDSLDGGSGNDTIYGGVGNDTLQGGAGTDSVFGDAGDDTFIVNNASQTDLIFGGDGNDTISFSTATVAANVVFSGTGTGTQNLVGVPAAAFSGIEGITGTELNDTLNAALHGTGVALSGLGGADSITGGGGADQLYGGLGNDTLTGNAGNDLLDGGSEADQLFGGTGDNTLFGGTGNDRLEATTGNDLLYGGAGADSLFGGDGADLLDGGDDADSLSGGTGNDSLYGGDGADTLDGGTGNDLLSGGLGNDSLTDLSGNNTLNGDDGNDRLETGTGADLLYGGAGLDSLYAGTGNDLLSGEDGNDLLDAGGGNDTLIGGAGNDSMLGQAGDDTFVLNGNDGTDTIVGGTTTNTLGDLIDATGMTGPTTVTFTGSQTGSLSASGTAAAFSNILRVNLGSGNDTVFGGSGAESVDGGLGDDSLLGAAGSDTLSGGDGNDTLVGGTGSDTLFGGAGDDRFVIGASDGSDSIVGGTGNDTLDFGGLTAAVTATFTGDGTGVISSSAGTTTFSQMEVLQTGSGNDTITGAGGNDTIVAGAGNDRVFGGAGTDVLFGGDGRDSLEGGDANDTLIGGAGSDTLYGGTGLDVVDYSASDAAVNVNLRTMSGQGGHAEGDVMAGIDGVVGSAFNDTIIGFDDESSAASDFYYNRFEGGAGNDILEGRGGSDALFGGADDDTVLGGDGNDTVDGGDGNDVLTGDAGNDTMSGGSGNDQMSGGADNDSMEGGDGADAMDGGTGNDSMAGGAGNDTILGGSGNDTMSGGSGRDTYVFTPGSGRDVITDLDLTLVDGQFTDRLDVSGLVDASGNPVNWADAVVTPDGAGGALVTFPGGEVIRLVGIDPALLSTKEALVQLGVPCFTTGTLILTDHGEVPVEAIRAGDRVMTLDHGLQPVIWAGGRHLDRAALEAEPLMRPVLIRDGAMGNRGDVLVSPNHAVLAEVDGVEMLVRAKHLAEMGDARFRIAKGKKEVGYHHLLLERHGIVYAQGMATETLYPGPMAVAALGPVVAAELAAAFPLLAPVLAGVAEAAELYGPTARPVAKRRQLLTGPNPMRRAAA